MRWTSCPRRPAAAAQAWTGLDRPWQEAFRQAWQALRTGNIAVGACASTPGGEIIYSARNRVNYGEGPRGEIFGSALADAETNVLARLLAVRGRHPARPDRHRAVRRIR